MPVQLTDFEDRLLDYLIGRKTPSTVKQLSKYFIRSESNINKSLRTLVAKGLVDVVKTGSMNLYVIKQ